MEDLFQPFAQRFDEMLTTVIAEKSKVFDIEETLPCLLTAQECKKMLGIGKYEEFQRVSNLKGFPKIDKGKGAYIKYPRDAVREWVKENWEMIA